MRARSILEVVTISAIIISISVISLLLLQEFSPGAFNAITGFATTGTSVNVTGASPLDCDFTLQKGLNLVSFHCIGDYLPLNSAVGNLTHIEGIWSYSQSSDKWKVYNPNLPSYVVNDLDSFTRKKGYWFKMGNSENFFYEGINPASVSISLSEGYNLVGYPNNDTEATNASLSGVSYSKVVGYDESSDSYLVYVPGSGGSLTQLEPFEGYWVNATSSDTWVVD